MEEKIYKKMAYISPEVNGIIEKIAKDENVIITNRFINEYNLENLLKEDLKTLNNLDFLAIDIRAISNSTSDNEIIRCLSNLRGLYNVRIIFIAQGYLKGNLLLARVFSKGIYNIVTAKNDLIFAEEFRKTISEYGMSFSNAQKFEIENDVFTTNTANIVKENYIKVKQDITVGVCGVERHVGTTTMALNITKFLAELINIRPCYIENNSHNSIIHLKDSFENVEDYENLNKIEYKNVEMFYNVQNVAEIKSNGYTFYIYDFGSLDEMTDNDINNFLNKDVKFVISGSKAWELINLENAFKKFKINLASIDENMYFLFNFCQEDYKNTINQNMGELKKQIYFSDIVLDPFIVANKLFLEKVFKKFLLNTSYEITKKKRRLKIDFKRFFKLKG